MLERRQQEIKLLREKYGELEVGSQLEWIVFKEIRLPEGWNRDATEVLVFVPPGYPVTPPDNFYVPTGFRLASNAMPQSYSDSKQHLGRQWGTFSVHIQKESWSPKPDILNGDNLMTYMLVVVEKRLKEIN